MLTLNIIDVMWSIVCKFFFFKYSKYRQNKVDIERHCGNKSISQLFFFLQDPIKSSFRRNTVSYLVSFIMV
jgi:hypothetical protein